MGGEETKVGGDYYGEQFYPRTRTEAAAIRNAGYVDSELPVQPFNKLYHIQPETGTATLLNEKYSFNPQEVAAEYNAPNVSSFVPNAPSIPPVNSYNPVEPVSTGIAESIKKPFQAVGEGISNAFDTTKNFVTSPFQNSQIPNVPDVNAQQVSQYVPPQPENLPPQAVNPSVIQNVPEEHLQHAEPKLGLGESMIGRGYMPPREPEPQPPQPEPQPVQYYYVEQPQVMYYQQPTYTYEQPQLLYTF